MNWKLIISIAIVYVGFLLHFMLHEELISKKSTDPNGFRWPYALLFVYNFCGMCAAFIGMLLTKARMPKSVLPYLKIALPQQIGLICTNYATQYVNYPTFQLMKSAKPVAVMLCQLLIFRKKIDTKRIIVVVILSIGLGVFGLSGKFEKSSHLGVLFACGALFCDAIYVPIVDQLKVSGGPFVTMALSFMWSSILVAIIRFPELLEAFTWVIHHQEVLIKLALYGITGSIAACALFVALSVSDGLVVAIATTTRKFFTILLSALIFRHNLRPMQWAGVAIVFVALGIEILFKQKKAPSLKK